MTLFLRLFAWLLAAAVTFVTLGPSEYRPHAHITRDGEHALAFVLIGLAFALAYPPGRGYGWLPYRSPLPEHSNCCSSSCRAGTRISRILWWTHWRPWRASRFAGWVMRSHRRAGTP
jgi:hypothetical protein